MRLSRRHVLLAAAAWPIATRAAPLAPTPRQTEGPFYPRELPLDSDNDLAVLAGRAERAKGTLCHVFGRVLDADGRPLSGARVEIWQCDAFGRYHHPGDRREGPLDENFQGFGAAVTAPDGGYRFRTIRPVPYPGRTPHIHFAVLASGRSRFVTQMYVDGEAQNARDGLYRSLRDDARARVTVTLAPAPELESGALAGRFDLVLES